MEIKYPQLAYSSITSNGIKYQAKFYKKMVLGIWEYDDSISSPFYRKEEKKMIESLNLVDLYKKKKINKILEVHDEKIKKIRETNEFRNKLDEIKENTKKELNELYLSQLTEEDKQKILEGKHIEMSKYPLVRDGEIGFYFQNIRFNSCFDDEDIKKIKEETEKKIEELEEFVKTVKAHIGIAKTKEEVEEILKRYEILDKKSGKLVIE